MATRPAAVCAFTTRVGGAYRPAASADWETAPDGVDILSGNELIHAHFPSFTPDIATVIHIRRAGDISGQQLGQFMLEAIRQRGGRLRRGRVVGIARGSGFTLRLQDGSNLRADRIVNATGPFLGEIAAMLGENGPPVVNVFQQKIAFDDREQAIPRVMPFSIDLDGQSLAWTDDEARGTGGRAEDGAIAGAECRASSCRPEGGDRGSWVKIGWAYNPSPGNPAGEAPLIPHFPDIVLRAASRLNLALGAYLGRLPRGARHYGGYYTMTPENWPLIGPTETPGAYIAGALSGFGTMAACATGATCAAWVADAERPGYAPALSPARYRDSALMAALTAGNKGIL